MFDYDNFDKLLSESNFDTEDELYTTEGANKDIMNYFKQAKKKYKEEMKAVKSCRKNNNNKEAIKHLDNAKTIVNKYADIIKNVDSDALEDILGYILRNLIISIKLLPLNIISGGVVYIGAWIADIINLINQYQKDKKDNKDFTSRLNFYRSSTLAIIDKYNKKIDSIKKEIELDI